jgi:hypothetical protein
MSQPVPAAIRGDAIRAHPVLTARPTVVAEPGRVHVPQGERSAHSVSH